jgi:Tfp pilus assembly protein PilP
MKLTTSVIILALVASASAQQKPAETPAPIKSGTVNLIVPAKAPAQTAKPAAAQTKTVAAQPKAMATQPSTAPAKKAPAKAPVVVVKAVPATPVKAKVAAKPVVKKPAPKVEPKVAAKAAEKPAEKPAESEADKKVAAIDHSKRDPFQTVIRERSGNGPCASGGKQCLVPDEVSLRGVVRSNGSIIAVVTTKDNRAYFLRENDPVLNGVVTRITEGSITFREKTTDIFGKSSMREVVKKINPTAV